ncbi:lysophospholipid acyltransferase family protein [Hydrogenophaga sp. IBVHS1]|jgi:KDO2-lipid IV(A) lauroyltransferase|uniref:lysophospholipid acyltransferase family protein n=1 Tax=unclassified Hydrogenophaga TaxID=2610897 RepID=UPI000A2D7BFB|nr:lysophospholipid acyltransferase family protein [Hydrogenophaga sp. IBVHS1]OSZ74299.1 lipid A biosynthesis acyltransferase [Hydrogenophaga sp. IBVHS1]
MAVLIRFLFRFASLLPLPVLHTLGWVLGWLSFGLSTRYRRRLFAHARQAGFSRGVALASVGESGKLVAELPRLWSGRSVRVVWEGAEHVEAALEKRSGVLFLTPHLGCFEVAAQAYADRFGERQPTTVLFRPARKAWQRDIMAGARERPGLFTAPTTVAGVKQLIKALRAGQAVGLLPDQVPPAGQGIWAPFFGREAYTMTLPARLVHAASAQLLLVWGERLRWGRGYCIHVRPFEFVGAGPLSDDATVAATQINQAMEMLVRECPEQYLWSYDRYKQPVAASR